MTTAPPPPDWAGPAAAVAADIGPPGGFWIRFVAFMIDALVLSVAGVILGGIFVAIVLLSDQAIDEKEGLSLDRWLGHLRLVLGLIVINWLYEALMTSSPRGATLGKQALGLRIVRRRRAALVRPRHRPPFPEGDDHARWCRSASAT